MNQSEKSIGPEIRSLNNLLARHFDRSYKTVIDDDVTFIHCRILRYIEKKSPEPVFQKDIEKKFGIAKSTVTSTLKLMEKKNLITRVAVDYDDRLKRLCLTDKGKYVNDTMLANAIHAEEQIRQGISAKELEQFFDVLERIKHNVEETVN